MKKIVTLLLCLAMVVGFAFSASAATVTSVPDSTNTADVLVKFTDSDDQPIAANTVYSVDVTFGTLEFTLEADTPSAGMVWNPTTHTYTTDGTNNVVYTLVDDEIGDAITVVNHSNVAVKADAKFDAAYAKETNGVTVNIWDAATSANPAGALTLATAVGTPVASAPTVVYALKASGTSNIASNFTVGTITVTIAAVS